MRQRAVWGALAVLLVAGPLPLAAQPVQCATNATGAYFWTAEGQLDRAPNCTSYEAATRCYRGQVVGTSVELLTPLCDPQTASCAVRAHAFLETPGVAQMAAGSSMPTHLVGTPFLEWFPCAGLACGAVASCGALSLSTAPIENDVIDTWVQTSVSCGDVLTRSFSLKATICQSIGGCQSEFRGEIPGFDIGAALGCFRAPTPTHNCGSGDATCDTCVAVHDGGASPAGEPPGVAPANSGPKALLRYSAGGAGFTGTPGWASWRPVLGLGWSHDYAQRIALDPQVGTIADVWLITEYGTFRHFTSLEAGSGLRRYQINAPSDEKRALFYDTASGGWRLESLNGTVMLFDSAGKWLSTSDRNGNTKAGIYNGGGQLTEVTMPDGRRELFTYHVTGKLATITEVGVGVASCAASPGDCRTWSYTWSKDVMTALLRPDGTGFVFRYTDGRFPGYMTQHITSGTPGTAGRGEIGWQLDSKGRVTAIWRGGTSVNSVGAPIPSTSTQTPAVELWRFQFTTVDAQGRVTRATVTDPLGDVSTRDFERDTVSDKPKLTNLEGDCPACGTGPNTQHVYSDPANPLLPTRTIDGRGIWTDFAYDPNGMVTRRIDAANNPFADPTLPRTTEWTYDSTYPSFVASVTGPYSGASGSRVTTRIYSAATGDLTSETAAGNEATYPGGAFSLTTSYSHNTAGQPLAIDPPGHGTADVTSFTYDLARGDLLPLTRTDPLVGATSFGYDVFNRRTSETDPNLVRIDTEYDALNRIKRTIQRGDNDALETDDLITRHFYNGLGDLTCTVLPRGNATQYVYDHAGRLTEVIRGTAVASPSGTSCLLTTVPRERVLYTLNGMGQRTNEKLQRAATTTFTTQSETTHAYSTRCHLDSVTRAPGQPEVSVMEYAYDCAGNLEVSWDGNHPRASFPAGSMSYAYDALNRLTTLLQPWGGAGGGDSITRYGYDAQDHLTSVKDAEGNQTSYVYSDRDLMTSESSPASGLTTHVYDDHGELRTTTDARGVVMQRTVDVLDRVTVVDYPTNTLDVSYTYDDPAVDFSKGRLTRITRGSTMVDYGYDRWGRLTRDGSLSYGLDANGNPLTVTYPGNVIARFSYDFGDRPVTLAGEQSGQPSQTIVSATTYKAFGPAAALTLGNGLTETRNFDLRYVPTEVRLAAGATNLLRWLYTTDDEGNVTLQDDTLAGGVDRAYTYQDYQYFLATASGPWPGPLGWTYDKIGNRLTETRGAVTDSYDYGDNPTGGNPPRLASVALSAGGTRAYGYTAAGQVDDVNAAGNAIDFNHDDAGQLARLARASAPVNGTVDFLYDGRGFLSEAKVFVPGFSENTVLVGRGAFNTPIFADGFETGDICGWDTWTGVDSPPICPKPTPPPFVNAVYSSEGLLHALFPDNGPDSQLVLYFARRPIAILETDTTSAGTWRYLTTDHLGTPIASTTPSPAAVTWSGGFEPFGHDWRAGTATGASENGVFLRLPGQWWEDTWSTASLGVESFYNVHRWYGVGEGRYWETDPLTMQNGRPSFYGYSDQRPSRLVDPLGLAVTFSPECSRVLTSKQRRTILRAAEDADAAGYACLDCAERNPYRKAMRGLMIRCDPYSFDTCGTGLRWCAARANFRLCDPTPLPGNTIILTTAGATGDGCPCLPRVLMHEALHIVRGSGHTGSGSEFPEVARCLRNCGRGYPGTR